jgi:hypothetical protein
MRCVCERERGLLCTCALSLLCRQRVLSHLGIVAVGSAERILIFHRFSGGATMQAHNPCHLPPERARVDRANAHSTRIT